MTTNPVDTSGILHFSQIVWKDTTQVGCAALQCSEGTGLNPDDVWPTAWAVVCAYSTGESFPVATRLGFPCPSKC